MSLSDLRSTICRPLILPNTILQICIDERSEIENEMSRQGGVTLVKKLIDGDYNGVGPFSIRNGDAPYILITVFRCNDEPY